VGLPRPDSSAITLSGQSAADYESERNSLQTTSPPCPPCIRVHFVLVAKRRVFRREHSRGSLGRLIGIGAAVARRPPSRPGEFHPEPLTEPDVSLSTYPARTTHGRRPSSTDIEFLRLPVDSDQFGWPAPFAPLKKAAILGGNQKHGGGAPQVKRKAAERFADLIDPDRALRELVALAYSSIDDVMTYTQKDGLKLKPFQQWPDRIKPTEADGVSANDRVQRKTGVREKSRKSHGRRNSAADCEVHDGDPTERENSFQGCVAGVRSAEVGRSNRKCRLEFSAVAHLRCGSRRSGWAGVDSRPRPGFRIAAGLHVGAQMPDESDSTRTAQRVGTRKVT